MDGPIQGSLGRRTRSVGKGTKLSIDDFEMKTLLGEGAYAKVFCARSKRNGKEYALKILDKKFIARHRKEQLIVNEKKVLSVLRHPGCMRLHATFQDSFNLYFVLDLCTGGDLITHIRNVGLI